MLNIQNDKISLASKNKQKKIINEMKKLSTHNAMAKQHKLEHVTNLNE